MKLSIRSQLNLIYSHKKRLVWLGVCRKAAPFFCFRTDLFCAWKSEETTILIIYATNSAQSAIRYLRWLHDFIKLRQFSQKWQSTSIALLRRQHTDFFLYAPTVRLWSWISTFARTGFIPWLALSDKLDRASILCSIPIVSSLFPYGSIHTLHRSKTSQKRVADALEGSAICLHTWLDHV